MRRILLALVLALAVFSSCSFLEEPVEGDIIRPDKPNVLKYISTEESRLYRHKLSPSLYQRGVPSYSLRNGGMVEVIVQFDSRITEDYAAILLEPIMGRSKGEEVGGLLVVLPEAKFWELVKHEHVEYITIKQAPERIRR